MWSATNPRSLSNSNQHKRALSPVHFRPGLEIAITEPSADGWKTTCLGCNENISHNFQTLSHVFYQVIFCVVSAKNGQHLFLVYILHFQNYLSLTFSVSRVLQCASKPIGHF